MTPLIPKSVLRRRSGLLGGHRRRLWPAALLLLQENRRQPEIEIRLLLLKLCQLLRPLAFTTAAAGGGSRACEPAIRVRVSDPPRVGAGHFGLRCFIGGRGGGSVEAHELRHGPQRAAAEHRLDRGLAHVPVPSPEKPHGTVHRVHRSATRFEEQRLKQSCIENTQRKEALVKNILEKRDI